MQLADRLVRIAVRRQRRQRPLTKCFSPSKNTNSTDPNGSAVWVDRAAPTVMQPVPLASAGGPTLWWPSLTSRQARWGGASMLGNTCLRSWLLEPTMVLTKLVIDVGGLEASTLGPPESARVGVGL